MHIHLGMDINQAHRPERHKGALGVLGGKTFKSQGSCQTAGPIGTNFGSRLRIHLAMGIGSIQVTPQYPKGMSGGGGVGGHTFKSLGKLSNDWTDWHQIWYTSVDSSENGHRLKQLAPRYHRAALWVVLWDQPFKRLFICGQTTGRIGNQFCTYNADESGNGQRLNKLVP